MSTDVFRFEPSAYAGEYAERGYVHVKGGVSPGFVQYALAQAKQLMGADADLKDWQFKGKKLQFLFDFPAAGAARDWSAMKDAVSALTGLARRRMTLCERHIKVYDAGAPESPPPHKDRLASEVAVGFPLLVAEGSHLVLYPGRHTEVNRFATTELHRRSLDADALPEKLLAGVEPVRIDMQPGDVVLFRGSSIYHERIRPARSIVLYLKFNALRLDPLGEDPSTPLARAAALAHLEASDEELLWLALEASPRLDRVTRLYSRLEWSEILQAQVWGEKEFCISERDLALIRAADGTTPIAALLERLGCGKHEVPPALAAIRRLVRLQALDLVPGSPALRTLLQGQFAGAAS
jgi:hypothetical protein